MEFEVTKKPGRKPRWRLRDTKSGKFVLLSPGRVHLPPTTAENRHVREAVDSVLTRLARERVATNAGS